MRARRTGVVLVAVVALSGCGGSSGGSSGPGLTSGQRQALIQQLEAVRGAAAARDVSGAQDALDRFRRSVLHLRRTGALDAAQARALRIGVARVLARVKSDNPPKPVPAPVVTQTTPAPAPLPPGKAKKHEHGKKHGKHDHSDEGGD